MVGRDFLGRIVYILCRLFIVLVINKIEELFQLFVLVT